MTTAALARDVALPRVLRGRVTAVCVTDRGPHRVAWFDGLRKEVPEGPTFDKPKPAIALADYLNGVTRPAVRGAPSLGAPGLPGPGGLQAQGAPQTAGNGPGGLDAGIGASPRSGPGTPRT